MIRSLLATTSLCLLIYSVIATSSMNKLTSLDDLHWKNRVIVVFIDSESNDNNAVREWVSTNGCRLDDREVIVISINEQKSELLANKPADKRSIDLDEATIQTLMQRRKFSDDSFELLLIGKDGGVKANSNRIQDLDEFITQIDGMPMRRQEVGKDQLTSDC